VALFNMAMEKKLWEKMGEKNVKSKGVAKK